MRKVKNKTVIVLIISAIIAGITNYISKDYFVFMGMKQVYIFWFYELIKILILFLFNLKIVNLFENRKEEETKRFIKNFSIYFISMFLIELLVWPGIFKGDEYYVFPNTKLLTFNYEQHYLTTVFYTICEKLYPSPATVVIVQLIIISMIFAKIMNIINKKGSKIEKIMMYIPFYLLPIIDSNLFPLRTSIISFLFLLMIFEIIDAYEDKTEKIIKEDNWKEKIKNYFSKSTWEIIAIAAFIGAWKTEFLYLMICITLLYMILYKIKIRKAFVMICTIFVIIKIINIPQKDPKTNSYELTAIINPLSMIISQDDWKSPNKEEDIANINGVINYNDLKNNASFINIPVYFKKISGRIIPKENKTKFVKTYVRLVAYNMYTFLRSRWDTFRYTIGLEKNVVNQTGYEDYNTLLKEEYHPKKRYYNAYPFSKPIFGQKLRENVIEILECRKINNFKETNFLYPIMFNMIPVILGLFIITIIEIVTKNKLFANINLLILIQFILVFLTAPAIFWMYYETTYLSGITMIIYELRELIKAKSKETK